MPDLCHSITDEGARCTRKAAAGSRYCWQHAPKSYRRTVFGAVTLLLTLSATVVGALADLSTLGVLPVGSPTVAPTEPHKTEATDTSTPEVSEPQVPATREALTDEPTGTPTATDLPQPTEEQPAATSTPSVDAGPAASWEAMAVVLLHDGSEVEVAVDTLAISSHRGGITFDDGIAVSTRDIDVIEVSQPFESDDDRKLVRLQVSLTDGRTRENDYSVASLVRGDTKLGEFQKLLSDVSRIEFRPSGVVATLTLHDGSRIEADADSLGVIHYVVLRGFPVRPDDLTVLFEDMESVEISDYDLTITLLDGTVLEEKLGGARPSSPFIGHAAFDDFQMQIREVRRVDFQR